MYAPNIARFAESFDKIKQVSGTNNAGGIYRVAFSKDDHAVHDFVLGLARERGFFAMYDEIGNLRIYSKTPSDQSKKVAIYSHLDNVGAGNFDGSFGVLAGLELMTALEENNVDLNFVLEVGSFRCEESTRFNVAMLGSKIASGQLTPKDLKKLYDNHGEWDRVSKKKSAYDFLAQRFEPDRYKDAVWNPNEYICLIEPHIEQGPTLRDNGKKVGLVTIIAAPTRYKIIIEGEENHSGATPMDSARRALSVENAQETLLREKRMIMEYAVEKGYKTVATFGDTKTPGGSMNTIPGRLEMLLDIRDVDLENRDKIEKLLINDIKDYCEINGFSISLDNTERGNPQKLSPEMLRLMEDIAIAQNIPYKVMHSGAGHDCKNFADKIPTMLVFHPCNGKSHSNKEAIDFDDSKHTLKLIYESILKINQQEGRIVLQ